jgi:hypothetical protein
MITLPYGTPYWEATASSSSDARGYPVSIGGVGYVVDLTDQRVQRSAIQVSRDRQPATQSEQLLVEQDVWRRVRDSWYQGDRQGTGDREDSLPYRFSTSRGVDVFTKWKMSLLPDTSLKIGVAATNPWVGVVDGQLAVVDGTSLRWYLTPSAGAVTRTLPAAALSVTTSGSSIFIACADGTIQTALAGGAISTFLSLAGVTFVAYLKDFLIASTTNVLYNITSGTAQVIRTHPLSTFRWVDGAEGQSCIYLIGGAGDRSVVHRLSIDDATSTLNPPIVASMLPDGETGRSLGSYMGYVFVGTSKGMRFGVAQGSGDLTLGPLIATVSPVRCFEGQDRFVWFGLSDFEVGYTGLGRVDLTTFTEPLAPASASDLAFPTSGEVTSVTTWEGLRVFAVAASGVYIQQGTLVASGYLTESDLTFGVPDTKNGHYVQVRTEPLKGTVTLDMAYDGADYRTVARAEAVGSSGSGNRGLNGVQFNRVTPRLTLTRSILDATEGPVVTGWEIRGEPVTGRGSQWQIPVIISSSLEVNGNVRSRDCDADRERLIGLVSAGTIVTYREGNVSWPVHLVDYLWKPTHQNSTGSFEGVLTLVAREVK